MKNCLKGTALIFVFKVIGALSQLVVNIIIARSYGVPALGVFSLTIILLTFGSMFSKLGLDMYVVRVLPGIESDRMQVAGFLQQVFRLLLIGALFVSSFVFFISPLIDNYIFKSFDALNSIYCVALAIIPATFFNVLPEIFRGLGNIKIYSFFRNVSQDLFTLLVLALLVFVFRLRIDPVYVFYAVLVVLSLVLGYLLHIFLIQKNITLFSHIKYDRGIIRYSFPMLLTVSMMFMMGNIDSLMISFYLDEREVGIYAACLKISMMTPFVLASINAFIAPKFSKAYAQQNFEAIKRTYYSTIWLSLSVSIPIFFGVVFFSEFLLGFFGDEFSSAVWVLLVISLSGLASSAFGSIGYLLCMTDSQSIVAKVIAISLIINIILNFIMIPKYGLIGAAITTLLCTLIWNVVLFFYSKKYGILRWSKNR